MSITVKLSLKMDSPTNQSSPQPPPAQPPEPARPPQPAREVTFPAPPVAEPAPVPVLAPARPPFLKLASAGSVTIAVLVIVAFSAYNYGLSQGRGHLANTAAPQTPIEVPQGATVISQCAVGRGTQYVLPSNIPHGPVFNVYQGKVVGLEYMIGVSDLAGNTSFYDLPLYGKKYDHIDVGLLSQGHAGYPEPHYHVDVFNISRAASAAITCK